MTDTPPEGEWFEVRFVAYLRAKDRHEAQARAGEEVREIQIVSHGQRDPRLDILNEASDPSGGGGNRTRVGGV